MAEEVRPHVLSPANRRSSVNRDLFRPSGQGNIGADSTQYLPPFPRYQCASLTVNQIRRRRHSP